MTDDGPFNARIAATYDAVHRGGDPDDRLHAIELLSELAGIGTALEFGIGTGRLALPLAERGVGVHGIDLSGAMIDRMRAKPGGDAIPTTVGDMATARVEGRFDLVYLAFNTITNLTTQEAQTACFRNAARHLNPGGAFLIETFVPPLQRLTPGDTRLTFQHSETHWGIDEIDVASQRMVSHHLYFRDGAWERFSVPARYVWPSELDLMAQIAGLALQSRWASWRRDPFVDGSRSHVSVWRKPDTIRPGS